MLVSQRKKYIQIQHRFINQPSDRSSIDIYSYVIGDLLRNWTRPGLDRLVTSAITCLRAILHQAPLTSYQDQAAW